MSQPAIIEADGLDVYYGASHILFDLGIAVLEGQTTALLGRNGAGKSTTLKALAGLAPVRRGRIASPGGSFRAASRTPLRVPALATSLRIARYFPNTRSRTIC